MDFINMDIATLTRSISGKGVRYLELFLREYTAIFPGPVNPSCPICINQYLNKYKKHHKAMANTCNYRLHAKYENIQLQFGSPILVNNDNITDDMAEILLARPNGARFFAQFPEGMEAPPLSFPPSLNDVPPVTELEEDEADIAQTDAE